MPEMRGLDVLERIMEVDPGTEEILVTAHYSSETAAIKKGATDYINKPVPLKMLREKINGLIQEVQKRQRALEIDQQVRVSANFRGIVGRNPQMWEMFSRIQRLAPQYRSVLITGETGTGKDLVARALHNLSPVASHRFVVFEHTA
jgi:DNA-binding NtrC family response regulator